MEMEMSKSSRMSLDVPVELLQHIQSLLPPKDAASTCILSKSWLRAWSTIPNLRFIPHERKVLSLYENETEYKKLIHSTLQRYHTHNLPIESFHLQYLNDLENIQYQEDINSWVRLVTSKSCLKDLSLNIRLFTGELTLPNELFSSQNLSTIYVNREADCVSDPERLRISTNPVINCVSLRVVDLELVSVTQAVFHKLLSTCTLLEKIRLHRCLGLNNVKIINLLRLRELDICSSIDKFWEIDNVPSLCSFRYYAEFPGWKKPMPFHIDSLQSVTQLHIGVVMINNSFFDIVKSNFHLLESLTLAIVHWEHEDMVITSASLKWLTLDVSHRGPVNAKINAQRLLSFEYRGNIPRFTFLTIVPEQIKLNYRSWGHIDHLFLLKLWETLNLSSKFEIDIESGVLDSVVSLNIDVDDLRSIVSYPVTDVKLSLETRLDESVWKNSRFFDAFFLICRPTYIKCSYLVIQMMLEWNKTDIKDVQYKNDDNGKWEAHLTSFQRSFLVQYPHWHVDCKLNWFPK